MPELPEVETIRRGLDKDIGGRKIRSVDVKSMKPLKRHPNKKHFAAMLEGAKVKGAARRGKYLLITLDNGNVVVIHLGMSGQLRRAANKDEVPKHTHIIINFTQGGNLRFIDPRTFGEVFAVAAEDLGEIAPELAELGLDPVDEPIAWQTFADMLMSRRVKLKPMLMDQKFLAGIGNIYSDEILFEAGLRHDRTSDSLTTQEIRRLYRAVVEILHDAIKYRGSTLADGGYLDIAGQPGEFQEHHRVYARDGEACRRCRTPIVKARVSNRSTYFCQQCQI
ncbi:MAG TPA: bifunctional DNA-formamidopyrimidine glycosylase/DNA-(apurinic or apyrimidinic site) lyase [Acidimicrobiales bacterium]